MVLIRPFSATDADIVDGDITPVCTPASGFAFAVGTTKQGTQLVMANSIASLRKVGSIDWSEFVETASATESVLRRDPSGIYGGMTFQTRDRYRHVVEHLSRRADVAEHEVAAAAIQAAAAAERSMGGSARAAAPTAARTASSAPT